MLKLWLLKRRLANLDGEVALWLSGGKDSRLLLEVLLDIGARFSILRFDHGWSREQRQVVDELTIKHNLRIYSYAPTGGVLVGDGEGELTAISAYPVGSRGETAAIFRDLVPGNKCAFDVSMPNRATSAAPPILFDLHLVGTKKGESHWALNGHSFLSSKAWEIGDTEFLAPLYRWNDSEVVRALREYGVEWVKPSEQQDTGNISCCDACLHGVNEVYCIKTGGTRAAVDWSPTQNLSDWQQAVGI